jgi:multiple sugar transport system substrate-binding protein
MNSAPKIVIKGMTWSHERAINPLHALAHKFSQSYSHVSFIWDDRPLHCFESQPLSELIDAYDLIVIDHPHLGGAVANNHLVDLTKLGPVGALSTLARQSVGASHRSYALAGGHWALAIDAASPIASYRPDLVTTPPQTLAEITDLIAKHKVAMPLKAPHALMAFLWIALNNRFEICEGPGEFIDRSDAVQTLETLRKLTSGTSEVCLNMNPIDVYEAMSGDIDGPAYCPHAYGYINYGHSGFRNYRLGFANVPDMGGGDSSGTVLGGTGMAVSVKSQHRDLAVKFAYFAASADVQAGLYTQFGGQPGNAAAWDSLTNNRLSNGFLKNTRQTLETAWLRPRYDGNLNFQTAASNAISDYLSGNVSARSCADNIRTLHKEFRK